MADDFLLILGIGFAFVFGIVIFTIVFFKLGGWPEFWYRVNDIPYFVEGIIKEDASTFKHIHKSEIIKGDPPMYSSHGNKRGTSSTNTLRYHGRPYWIYLADELNPVRMLDQSAPRISSSEVQAAFERKALADMHGIGQKGFPPILIFILVVGVIAIMVAGISAYFSYNAFCALNPHACGSVPGVKVG